MCEPALGPGLANAAAGPAAAAATLAPHPKATEAPGGIGSYHQAQEEQMQDMAPILCAAGQSYSPAARCFPWRVRTRMWSTARECYTNAPGILDQACTESASTHCAMLIFMATTWPAAATAYHTTGRAWCLLVRAWQPAETITPNLDLQASDLKSRLQHAL